MATSWEWAWARDAPASAPTFLNARVYARAGSAAWAAELPRGAYRGLFRAYRERIAARATCSGQAITTSCRPAAGTAANNPSTVAGTTGSGSTAG